MCERCWEAFDEAFVGRLGLVGVSIGLFDRRFNGREQLDRQAVRPRSVPSGLPVPLDGQQFPFL